MVEEKAKPMALVVVVVAMKGHPGFDKSKVAHAISTALRCPLLDKDDVRDYTLLIERVDDLAVNMLNELSYAVLWWVAERQVQLGLSLSVDSLLSCAHLDAFTRLRTILPVVVDCWPDIEEEWHRGLEKRGAANVDGGVDGWHKPKT